MDAEKCSEWLNVKEVAHLLRMSDQWVYGHISYLEPKLPAYRMGRSIRIKREDVEAFREQLAVR